MELKIKNILKNYGLNKNEVDIYLSSLELGSASMSAIAKKSGVKRPTAYLAYNILEKQGLMGSIKKSSGLHFFAKDPAILSQKAKQILSDVNNIIPELRRIEGKDINKPKVTYYEGIENYKEIVEGILRQPDTTFYAIGSVGKIFEILTKKYDQEYYIPKRVQQKIKAKIILPYRDEKSVDWMDHKRELREVKYLSKGTELNTLLIIHNNKVIRIDSRDGIFITVVEGETFAKDEKTKFELLWKSLS